jgi:hypothetical protein
VDNTSDINKVISTLTQTALDFKADENTVVKLMGDQSISRTKTFDHVNINGNTVFGDGNSTDTLTANCDIYLIGDNFHVCSTVAETDGVLENAIGNSIATSLLL